MMIPKPRALLFDLDGTLIDSAVAMTEAVNVLLERRGLPGMETRRMRDLVSLGANDILHHALGATCNEPGANLESVVHEFRAIYRAMTPDPKDLFPHALDTLRMLNAEGYALGICTNKPEDLARHIITGTGLAATMRAIVGGREGLPAKPDPAPLLEVLRQLNVAPSEAIYVGDSEVDAAAAAAAGLPFVLVNFGYAIGDAEHIACAARIDDFRELINIIAPRPTR